MPDFHTSCSSITATCQKNKILTEVVQLRILGDFSDREPRLEQQQGNALHQLQGVDLPGELRVVAPHDPEHGVLALE